MVRNATRLFLVVGLIGLGWAAGHAQTAERGAGLGTPMPPERQASNAQPPPRSVEAAEAEGAKYPQGLAGVDTAAWDKENAEAAGTRDRQCVDLEKHAAASVRSGDFVAGNFAQYIVMAGSGKRKVWWSPRHNSAAMPPLQLRATKVGAPDVSVDWTLPSVVRAVGGNPYFFNTLIVFPENGKWLVVANSADNWGCFLITEINAPKKTASSAPH
jgi:hypothetical protein